ncbi:MAG: DNRLRE domain-containing protein [Kiritimatiellae bacterium]|nr:DNRLRE domain-containing protein [Kiritimatiellia bacterium]
MEPPTLNLSINPGKFIIPARADAYIRGDQYYTNNYGHVTALALKGSTSTEYNRKAYLGFEVPDREEGDAVLQAGLRVELNSRQDNSNGEATAPLNVWGLKESPSGDSWVEGDGGANLDMTGPITWNNAPGIDASSIDMDSDEVVLLGTLPIADKSSGDILTLESAAMREFIAADTNGLVTIILQSVEDRSSDIKSKENSGASIQPTLDLLFGPSLGTMIMVQ